MASPPPAQPRTTAARVGIAEAATYADVSIRTIRRWIAAGLLPGYRLGPRLVKVDLADLDKLARRIPTGGVPRDGRDTTNGPAAYEPIQRRDHLDRHGHRRTAARRSMG